METAAVLRLRPATACRRQGRRVGEGLGAAVFVGEEQRGASEQKAMEAKGV